MERPVCSVIVPVYFEEEVICETYKRLKTVMEGTGESYEIIFVNDGSRDRTKELALEICANDKTVKLIDFSRNFGHQNAITAGMNNSSGQCVVVIDADLQDPPEVIPKMIAKWREGYDIVYGKRVKREGETVFKKVTAKAFYRILDKMTEVDIPVDTGDFRLIDRKVCDALKNDISERNRYVRGIVSWLGFKAAPVEFVREKRFAGETKYPLKKMIKFAGDAIMSFSYKPLRWALIFGLPLGAVSLISLIVMIILTACGVLAPVAGWSLIAISCVFGCTAMVLIALGIIGEYVARTYDEAKDRPLYVINEKINFDD
ncbi:MAG: glycosyltransferase family 2 protein [Clostridia bacterium]|nr:glycosyltransferase family 2 protein [Clostridia bacterium]